VNPLRATLPCYVHRLAANLTHHNAPLPGELKLHLEPCRREEAARDRVCVHRATLRRGRGGRHRPGEVPFYDGGERETSGGAVAAATLACGTGLAQRGTFVQVDQNGAHGV
jgi:hypothetical protein